MSDHRRWQSTHGAASIPAPEAATPPHRPAPMPRQALVFWTPRLVLSTMLTLVKEPRRPQPALQHAPVPVTIDEPR